MTVPKTSKTGLECNISLQPLCRFKFIIIWQICYTAKYMLFNKKHQKKIQTAWVVVCVLIIISMILLYMPIFR